MNIAFTGHRDFDGDICGATLRGAIIEGVEGGAVDFYSGMAVGFDLAAAEVVLALRDEGHIVRLHCVLPYKGQALHYSPKDQARYDSVLRRADDVVVLADEYSCDVFFRRNDYLVERADLIIAYFDGEQRGGTAYTIRRARRARVGVINIYPQYQLSLF